MDRQLMRKRIFSSAASLEFNAIAVEIFHFQYRNNEIYRQFVDGLTTDIALTKTIEQVPFLPVTFFKTHKILCGNPEPEAVFESSGTTGMDTSRHYVADFSLYEESFTRGFELFYGSPSQYAIFALLPSYLERKGSSLVYMIERLLWKSNRLFGGFYLNELEKLAIDLKAATDAGKKTILFGVSFALLEMASRFPIHIPDTLIFETGGMKGRQVEITREELHDRLKQAFGVQSIHSEYGMTELFSQAWSQKDGKYFSPPWMKILISDPTDPLSLLDNGRTGGINVIDLANLDSCCFLATQDLGKINPDGSFEVLGRFDSGDLRGCSLLVT